MLFTAKGEKDWSKSVNAKLLSQGLAAMRQSEDEEYPEETNKWFDIEEEAREQQVGIWQFGGELGDESD